MFCQYIAHVLLMFKLNQEIPLTSHQSIDNGKRRHGNGLYQIKIQKSSFRKTWRFIVKAE